MTNKQYENRIKKLMALEAEKKALEKEIESVKAAITDSMGPLETVETENFVIRFALISGSRFDTKSFKADYSTLYNEYQVPNNYMRFSYKAV